jgi:conjugal transfer mating pair stabilization protein TraG
MAEGGAAGIADRARNERLTSIVDKERLTRMQGLLAENGIKLSKRQIAMDQNGDLSLNLAPDTAAAMWKAGLINESQLGAIANGGHARFSFAHNDLLVSSGTDFSRSARSDTSTRFEAGKQAGPDTIEHFMGGGAEGQAMLANWLRGGFEMDRKGEWRLKPQVADTLQRDVQAIMAQTGWQRTLSRSAQDQTTMGTTVGIEAGGTVSTSDSEGTSTGSSSGGKGRQRGTTQTVSKGKTTVGRFGGDVGFRSTDQGVTSETAQSTMDVVNYDVRDSIAAAERTAARSSNPEATFSRSCRTASSVAKVCAIATSRTQMMVAPLSTSPGH